MTMDDLVPALYPYVIDNVNFGERFISINYSDPTQRTDDIAHFDQLVFPAEIVDEDLGELTDLICLLIDKVQTMRRGPAPRIVPRAARGG